MASKNVVNLNDTNFQTEVYSGSMPTLVDFWAPWCGPCKRIGPIIDELADEYAGRVKVAKYDVDQSQQVAGQFGIASIPAIIIFDGNDVKARFVGVVTKAKLKEALDKIVGP